MSKEEVFEDMILACLERDMLLSAWEADFIEALKVRMESGHDLTEAQEQKLLEIYDQTMEAEGWQKH